MSFQTLHHRISPRLRAIARKHAGRSPRFDENDLYQEMCMHLWEKYRYGATPNVNDAYIVKSCEFHILNYIRKESEKRTVLSLDQPISSEGETLKETIPSKAEPIIQYTDRKLTIEEVKGASLTKREEEVFSLLLEGRTTREVGDVLGISHVMVVKCKQRLISKWQNKTKPKM